MAIQHHIPPRFSPPEILDASNHAELLTFLSADMPLNLFQLSWLENYGVESPRKASAFIFVGVRTAQGKLAAAAILVGRSLALLDSRQADAAALLGRWVRAQKIHLDHIASATGCVDAFWEAYAAGDPLNRDADMPGPPQLQAKARRAQTLYTLERARWKDFSTPPDDAPPNIHPRLAHLDELDALFLASARMHREETHIDPLGDDPEGFRRHVAHRISTGRTFVHFDAHRRLLFKAELSAFSRFGAQISGVYTDPICRRKGIATAAIFDICKQLFEGGARRITLYVNDDNEAAHRLYRKVGFEFHAPYQTVFV